MDKTFLAGDGGDSSTVGKRHGYLLSMMRVRGNKNTSTDLLWMKRSLCHPWKTSRVSTGLWEYHEIKKSSLRGLQVFTGGGDAAFSSWRWSILGKNSSRVSCILSGQRLQLLLQRCFRDCQQVRIGGWKYKDSLIMLEKKKQAIPISSKSEACKICVVLLAVFVISLYD